MELTATRLLIIVIEIAGIALSATLVYLFAKIYQTKRSFFLSLPIGFFFLLSSYFFLLAHHLNWIFGTAPLSSSIMWMRTIAQTIGFALIALSYLFAGRYQNVTKKSFLVILAGSTTLMLSTVGLVYFINPAGLPSIYLNIQLFTLANIALLSYIIIFLARKLLMTKTRNTAFVASTVAFVCLWLGQIIFSVHASAVGDVVLLVGSQVARIVSFAIFIIIYYLASKEASPGHDQKKQS